jgi:hypothetical protein
LDAQILAFSTEFRIKIRAVGRLKDVLLSRFCNPAGCGGVSMG